MMVMMVMMMMMMMMMMMSHAAFEQLHNNHAVLFCGSVAAGNTQLIDE